MSERIRKDLSTPGGWLMIEMLVIALWGLFVGRDLLDFSNNVTIAGRDYTSTMQGTHLWEHIRECGLCALWNGDINGGAPAFADSMSPIVHPYTIVTTIFLGVIDGAKVLTLLILITAGLGQLWIGYKLGVGRAARLAIALLAVPAGHVTGPLEGGNLPIALGTATTSLVIGAILHYVHWKTRGAIALLGICLALLIVAGHGYVQLATLVLLPLSVILVPWTKEGLQRLAVDGLKTACIAVLTAGVLLVPLLHIYGSLGKNQDFDFTGGQSLGDTALNLVIDDWSFYQTDALGKQPFGSQYINYVGWLAVGLAVVGFAALLRRNPRMALFLASFILGGLWIATMRPVELLYDNLHWFPAARDFLSGLRTIMFVNGIAVPPLLALSAVGFDSMFSWRPSQEPVRFEARWPSKHLRFAVPLDLRMPLVVVTLLSLLSLNSFAQNWIRLDHNDMASIDEVLDPLETQHLQWVQPPFGEQWMTPYTVPRGLKVANQERGWWIGQQVFPPPYLQIVRGGTPEGEGVPFWSSGDLTGYRMTGSPEYASLDLRSGESPCEAAGGGGTIDIVCATDRAGELVVLETERPGWDATVNGEEQSVDSRDGWLAVDIPAGESTIELRYRPWDVWIGLALSVIGLLWAAYWIAGPRFERREAAPEATPAEAGPEVDFIPYETDR